MDKTNFLDEKLIYENQIQAALRNLYRSGQIVKALDDSGQPFFRNGRQVYKYIKYATDSERAFWKWENTAVN
jgi:hypothetical protein